MHGKSTSIAPLGWLISVTQSQFSCCLRCGLYKRHWLSLQLTSHLHQRVCFGALPIQRRVLYTPPGQRARTSQPDLLSQALKPDLHQPRKFRFRGLWQLSFPNPCNSRSALRCHLVFRCRALNKVLIFYQPLMLRFHKPIPLLSPLKSQRWLHR